MACFIAPAGVAVVTTIVQKVVKKKEDAAAGERAVKTTGKWTQRLRWLNTMLWGGTLLLALEHVWHGELVPWPPFLTAMETSGGIGPMLREIATYGATMTAAVLVIWGVMVWIAVTAERRARVANPPAVRAQGCDRRRVMWLLITALAALVTSVLWYVTAPADKYKLGFLSLLYWGATLMWLVDHVMAYVQEGGRFFEITADATGLGLSVLVLGLVVWLVRLLVSDPKRILGAVLKR